MVLQNFEELTCHSKVTTQFRRVESVIDMNPSVGGDITLKTECTLSFKKDDMISRYLPLQKEVSLQVDLVRKYCYRLCEEFTRAKTIAFLENLEKDFACKNLKYISRDEKKAYTVDCLEMYFLFLETEEYITSQNVKNLANVFKQMDLLNLHDEFTDLQDKISKKEAARCLCTPKYNVDRTPHEFYRSSSSKEAEELSETEENSVESIADVYDINPKCPGLLLIINNEYFHTESRKEYQNKLAKTDFKLENRNGSQADKTRLEETFRRLGFDIVSEDNLIHVEMLKVLLRTVKKFQHSCLVVAILSHGDQGIVYGANSVSLEITEIQRIVCDKGLSGKPKVLLLQACQGSDCQKINGDDWYQTDSPKKYTPPRTTDLLTFRATISGYSAVRHVVHGTWFIQNFCKAIEEYPNDHIQEICTKVIAEVSRKTWGEKCMVPLMETTFTKRLYLKMI
ncbi:caspase [Holotrichia oblita]|uniref:Caspase n=1 Tax=Holotrichia oblita TaxID=644536 RepID=A0ACB9TER0_HOLOL|nr:caspase [Holotrichia oblita]